VLIDTEEYYCKHDTPERDVFRVTSDNVSETVQDRDTVTMED